MENNETTPRTPILEDKPIHVKLLFWGLVALAVYGSYKIVTKKHGTTW
jgi:hypothetical protein